jgi:hypothetical protein
VISPPLNASDPIVNDDGTMAQAFRNYMIKLWPGIPLTGTGSPEGVVQAPQYALYIDITTPTVPVQYRKMLGSIGGDEKQGWIAV